MWTELTDMTVSTVGGRPDLFCWFAGGGCQVRCQVLNTLMSIGWALQRALVSSLGFFSQQPKQESFGHGVAPSSPAGPFRPKAEEKGISRAR